MLNVKPTITTQHRYAAFALSVALIAYSSQAFAQTEEGFVPLFNGESLDGWVVENSKGDNFYVNDGILRVEEPEGWLRSEKKYSDFKLHVEFRFLGDVADSGVFLRVAGESIFGRGWPTRSYQVQTIDVSTDRTTRFKFIGDIYRHRMPDGFTWYDTETALRVIRSTGEWQSFDIEVIADSVTVMLNGTLITRAKGIGNPAGYIGLQGETSIVEYRAIEIREIPSSDEAMLLAMHERILQAHRSGDIEDWMAMGAEEYVSANGGRITFPTPSERRAAREPYLESTTFTIYRDVRPPIVHISDDATTGWLIAEVEMEGNQVSENGENESIKAVWAWIELYKKTDGVWQIVGNVSNRRPE